MKNVVASNNINGQRVYDIIYAAYKLRNDLVHVGETTSKWQAIYGHIAPDQHSLVHEVEELVREALRNTISSLVGLQLKVPAGKILIG